VIDVQYPVVAPENLVYNLEVNNQTSGFQWTGTVKATDGVVSELSAVIPAQVTPTPTASPTPTQQACSDAMEYVRDVTVPDGTQFQPDEPFVKTWRLRNTGTCTWTSEYKLAFSEGEAMGASQDIPLPLQVAPGSEANLSVNLTAPTTPGLYRSDWKLRNPNGVFFGSGEDRDEPFFVEIEVVAGEGELQLGAPDWLDPLDDSQFWFLVNDENTKFEIDDGKLRMLSRQSGSFDQWGLATKGALTDFYLEATFITGKTCTGLDRYGVLVRAPDTNSGYVYGFSCDGRYRIYKWDGENYQALKEWTNSGFILSGTEQTNKLGIRLEGSTIKLYANGKLLAELEDREYDEGRFGLFIGSANTDDLEIFVDEVAYWLVD
ncbi:MAG TPA: NBR1-Ig-like domain-containing protein, partial [Anaerolineales bacterium]|nr:NBR1-Ig-like domain-containing protein [Anaerolineales bacterium]